VPGEDAFGHTHTGSGGGEVGRPLRPVEQEGNHMDRFSFVVSLLVLLATVGAGAAQEKPAAGKAGAKPAAAATSPINLNTATVAQLETLPGIGARTAQAIVDHRQKNGSFKKIEELMNIKGIGEKSFLKLKPMITVGNTDKPEKPGDRQ
jgi:comEA protein